MFDKRILISESRRCLLEMCDCALHLLQLLVKFYSIATKYSKRILVNTQFWGSKNFSYLQIGLASNRKKNHRIRGVEREPFDFVSLSKLCCHLARSSRGKMKHNRAKKCVANNTNTRGKSRLTKRRATFTVSLQLRPSNRTLRLA